MAFTDTDLNDPNIPTHMKEAVARLNELVKIAPNEVTRLLETETELSDQMEADLDRQVSSIITREGKKSKIGALSGLGLLATCINTGSYRIYGSIDDDAGKGPYTRFGIFKVD